MLQDLLKKNNFTFKKSFGQNFISDTNLLNAIVNDAGVTDNDEVLEIGCGAGTLTKAIGEKAKKVISFEVDKSLKLIIEENLKEQNNIDVIFDDFLKANNQEVNSMFKGKFKVIANLPYYITTPIIFKLIEENFNVSSLTIMVQKEFAERLVAKPKTKEYGTITVELNSVANVKILRTVSRKLFTPEPNVDSCVVQIDFHNKYNIPDKKFLKKVIDASFSMRRKTLNNCLKKHFGLTTESIQNIFAKINISENARAEELSVTQFLDLATLIRNY